ncbi:hypothetical protein EWM64_g10011 [Hericium alpestre]|uniref:Uncharacterized protein n=1 Tax=Hericium alpestre TaxID=135208 RepID=A0A4Y9ZIL6_9AGAM|nr:hypothetical protein EWM64_g10011 [Hericium alpestre]
MDYAGMWPMFVCMWQSPVHMVFPSIQHIRVIDEALCMSDYVWRYPLSPPATHRFTMFDETSAPIANSIRLLSIIYMTSQLSNLLRGPIVYLEFKANRGERPFHYLELTAHNAPFPDSSFKPLLNFNFDCINHGDVNPIWFQMLLFGLSDQLAYVQELTLTNMDAYKPVDLSQLLRSMRSVRKLELLMDEDGPHPIVELLGSVVAERWDERTGTVQRELYLPHLDEFRLGMEDATGNMLELLIQSLGKRKEWGSPLRMLHISASEDYPIEDPEESLLLQLVSSLEFEYL